MIIRIFLGCLSYLAVGALGQSNDAPTTPGPTTAFTSLDGGPTTLSTAAPTTDIEITTPPASAIQSTAAPTWEGSSYTPAPTSNKEAISSPSPRATASPTVAAKETTAPSTAPVVVPPTPVPTTTTPPTTAPTPSPTPPPTFSSTSYCERPGKWSNESSSGLPCVELTTYEDRENGVGAFYDEEGCGPQAESTSVVGCSFGGVSNCRLCVYHRALYSENILGGEEVPYVDCPCCVPDVYERGGDIDCDFAHSAAPVKGVTPTSSPNEGTSASAGGTAAPGAEGSTVNQTISTPAPTIGMEACEASGENASGESIVCVNIAASTDKENGLGTFYQSNCRGVGCSIAGYSDCRQCVFDNAAYAEAGGDLALVDCPCCVPVTYKLRPEVSECDWPPTPSPTISPTTRAEFVAQNGAHGTRTRGCGLLPAGIVALLALCC